MAKTRKLRKEYKEHLNNIEQAQRDFDSAPHHGTATKLSNLKNNMFQEIDEIFTKKYIKEKEAELEEDQKLKIIYEPGKYNHRAKSLKIVRA